MKVIAVIPARYAANRFPAKLMQDLGGKTVIRRTYEAARATGLFDEVFVVTDSELIADEIRKHAGKALLSQTEHESGSDRIAEAVRDLETDIVLNVQGDEPFIDKDSLARLIDVFRADPDQKIDLASLMTPLEGREAIDNPNHVKVVADALGFALYFSRAPIPFNRDNSAHAAYFRHIGVYAFRKQALLDFASWPPSPLEALEKLEQLRYLEHGKRIRMIQTQHSSIGIDTPEDLERARLFLQQQTQQKTAPKGGRN